MIPFKNREKLKYGECVDVHYNFLKKCFSITTNGVVRSHSFAVRLTDPVFKVSEAGRQRVIRNKRKNVHARIGGLLSEYTETDLAGYSMCGYNPYLYGYFFDVKTKKEISKCTEVILLNGKVYYK